jgi:hypothetical protein
MIFVHPSAGQAPLPDLFGVNALNTINEQVKRTGQEEGLAPARKIMHY